MSITGYGVKCLVINKKKTIYNNVQCLSVGTAVHAPVSLVRVSAGVWLSALHQTFPTGKITIRGGEVMMVMMMMMRHQSKPNMPDPVSWVW